MPVGKVMNINNASLEELDKLWGVGKIIAQSIIDYRDARGVSKHRKKLSL